VAGAGVWLGTLAVLVGVAMPALAHLPWPARTPALLALVRAFTPVALAGVTALTVSGVASTALRLVPAWTGELRWPALGVYGWVLGAKLAAVLPTAALGFWHWRRAAARLAAAPAEEAAAPAASPQEQALDDGEFAALPPTSRRIARSMTAEVVLAGVVLVATALLVATPPPAPPDAYGADAPAADP
jgi:putative copper export protein